MNEDTVKGNWKQVSGKIKQKWGKLTDDDLMKAEGDKDYLLGKLQEHYGLAKDKAEQFLKAPGH
ncbi:MAG TPA: CsbD family protein [Thiobacillus sp.]